MEDQKGFIQKKSALTAILILAIFIGLGLVSEWNKINQTPSDISRPQPPDIPLQQPKDITFQWKYRGSPYTLMATLYKTVYDYYQLKLREAVQMKFECNLPVYLEENCKVRANQQLVVKLLERPKEDNTISQIASEFKSIGEKAGLDEDQIVDLAITFVQSIPYDEVKAEAIKSSTSTEGDFKLLPKHPYETLYDNRGVCSDKSLLATSLIQELGYGVVIFTYDPLLFMTGHMGLGIKCPKEYSSYNSGYCYTEVTDPGWKVGIIPSSENSLETSWFHFPSIVDLEKEPKILYIKGDGKTYNGVVENIRILEEKVVPLIEEIKKLDKDLTSYKLHLDLIESYKYLVAEEYNHYVDLYNKTLEIYQQKIEELKKIIESY